MAPTSRLEQPRSDCSQPRASCGAAPAPGRGRGAWGPDVGRKLGRQESGAWEGRGVPSDSRTNTGTTKTRQRTFAWPGRPLARSEGRAKLQASLWSWSRRQSSAGSCGEADPSPARASRPRLGLPHSGTLARTHLDTIIDAHTLASSTKQAGALESRGVGTRATERGGTFRRSVGSPGSSELLPRPCPPQPAPESLDCSARESPGRPGRSSQALSAADAASLRPAPRAGKGSKASAETEGAGGAAVHRRAAASESHGAKV